MVYIYNCSLLQSKRSIGFFLISRAKIRSFSLFHNKKVKKKKKKTNNKNQRTKNFNSLVNSKNHTHSLPRLVLCDSTVYS